MLDDIVFVNAVQYILTALLGVGALWVVVRLSPSAVKSAKDVWIIGRAYKPMILAGVDQPTDPIPQKIDGLFDKLLPADWDRYASVMLPAILRAAADAMDGVLGVPDEADDVPEPEHIPDGAAEAVK